MSWTIPDAMQAAFEDAEVELVVAAEIQLPLLRWLTVEDYTQGATEEVTIDANSNTRTIVEGTHFSAATSNEATAQAIANAWNSDIDRVTAVQTMAVWRGGVNVAFVGLHYGIDTMTVTSTNTDAWAENLPANPTEFGFCSHVGYLHPSLEEFVPVISGIAGLEWSLDPKSRETEIPQIDLDISDGREIRELMNYYSLAATPVSLRLGAYTDASLTYPDDFVELPTLHIEDIIPGPGKIELKLVDAAGDSWRDTPVGGAWVGWHPLQVVLDVLTKARAGAGFHYVAASLDYETADPARSHFCLSRYHDVTYGLKNSLVGEETEAGELVTDLLALMGGTWRPTQSGPYEFVAFNRSASAVAQFDSGAITGHDVDEVDQRSSLNLAINDVRVAFGRGDDGKKRSHQDTDALSLFQRNGRFSSYQHRSDWLNSVAELNITPGVLGQYVHSTPPAVASDLIIQDNTEEFPVLHASRQGFCGTQRTGPVNGPTTLAPGMSLGAAAGRYAVIRLAPTTPAQNSDNSSSLERILISDWTLHEDLPDSPSVQASGAPPIRSENAYAAVVCQDDPDTVLPNGDTLREFFGADAGGTWPANPYSGRALESGNVPEWWAGAISEIIDGNIVTQVFDLPLEDITIAWYMARELVRRFRHGAPRVTIRTTLAFMFVDLGEFVTLQSDDMMTGYLRGDGADTNVVWEVTGRKFDIFGDTPGMEFELTFVRDDALVSPPIASTIQPEIDAVGTVTVISPVDESYVMVESSPGVFDGYVTTEDGSLVTA